MLKFDAETTRLLDSAYQGVDITRRRQGSFVAADPKPGETILDLGCGNGLLSAELARAVGSAGHVIGVDPSTEMLASAQERCGGFGCVHFLEGSAYQLPLETVSIDKILSVQVFEYLDDIPAALSEAWRVLRPGGRLVIGDIHFDSLVWHTENPARMARMMAAWDRHFVERRVPALLPPLLRDAGFVLEKITPVPVVDHDLRPDGLAQMMLRLIEGYAIQNDLVPAAEAQAWCAEQEALAAAGRFFFSVTHFVVSARKP